MGETVITSSRLVSHKEIISYLWMVFSALRRVIREKSLVAKEFRFQLQKDKKPVENSSDTRGPGLGWTSPLKTIDNMSTHKAASSEGSWKKKRICWFIWIRRNWPNLCPTLGKNLANLKRSKMDSSVRSSRIGKSVKQMISMSISAKTKNEENIVYNVGWNRWKGLFLFLLWRFKGTWKGIKDTWLIRCDAMQNKKSNKIEPKIVE